MKNSTRTALGLTLAVVLPLGLAGFTPAAGAPGEPPMGPPMGPPMFHGLSMHLQHALDQLDLSSSQEQAIKEILQADRAAREAGRDQAIAAHRALHDAIIAETFDEGAIRNAGAAVAAVLADDAVADAKLLVNVRALLTTDQRDQLDQILSHPPMAGDMEPSSGGMHHHGPHHGGPGR